MRLRPALAALSAAALLSLAACGGDSDDATTATGGSSSAEQTSSSSAEGGSGSGDTDAQTVAFCTEGQASLEGFDDQIDAAGPEGLATILPQLVDAIDALEPPAAIASDVQTLRDAYDQLAQAAAANDLSTPEGQQAFQDAYSQLQPTAQPAEDALEQWTDANCADDDAAPTS